MESIIGREFVAKVVPKIDGARKNIKIIVFDWRWYANDPGNPVQIFNQGIVRACKRGVNVEVVGNCDNVLQILRSVGCKARKVLSKKLVHAKMIIIDDCDVIVGSHNFTQNAFTMNQEVSVYIPKFQEIGRLVSYFESMFNY